MLKRDQTVFVLVDVQGKLAQIVEDSEVLHDNLEKLIKGLQVMNIPILWLEQYPDGLGPTTESLASLLEGQKPIAKMTFSGARNEEFMKQLKDLDRKQILIAGIETHICVYMTAADLAKQDYEVEVVTDAVTSRTEDNKRIGLQKMNALGIAGTCVETALYELLGEAGTEEFKQVLKVIK
ncbi:hydrolase [Sporosarcina sp. P37]|uniref:isochorismatase family protein n=1 Tax=unclassified Sporosarcina TaxID=2647733 RepID=UPI0009BE85B3|nr:MULTISPECIES: isochorismatase family protein [unclassified Sporosarcina]ARD47343.1 hydrolase [Sporosarcina sp. P33]ARK23909.1 hydrolase [Sporosarcina sp. P37]PID17721.1 hydrolase [Sporosarcina sp. P35]